MPTTNIVPVMGEYEVQRGYLATADIGIAELFEKTIQMLIFISDSNVRKEQVNG